MQGEGVAKFGFLLLFIYLLEPPSAILVVILQILYLFTQLDYGQLSHSLEVQEPLSVVRVVVVIVIVVVVVVSGYKLLLFDMRSFPFVCA